jgi:hypothetical protein
MNDTPARTGGWGLHPALWRLLKLQWKARARSSLRQLKTLRGAVYSLLLLVIFGLWLVPAVMMAWSSPAVDPAIPRAILPPAMLVFFFVTLLTSGIEVGVYFAPAEVDLLFPAPFSRRQLLVYRIINLMIGLLLGSVFFSIMAMRWSRLWVAAYLGVSLSLLFLSLVQMLLGVLTSVVAAATYSRLRWGLLLGIGLVLGLGAWHIWPRGEVFDLLSGLQRLSDEWWGQVLLAPFLVLTRLITAQNWLELLVWLPVALGMNLGVVGLILWWDAHFLEQAVAASQRMQVKLQSVRRGQGFTAAVKPRGRLRSPRLPHLGGAGPVGWRQLTMALRNSHFALLFVGLITAMATLPLLFANKNVGLGAVAPALSMLVFLLPQMLQYDFRSDVERMDVLKSLPFSPWGVVLGQLVAPVLLATLMSLLMLVGLWGTGLVKAQEAAMGCLLTPAINLFVFSSENLMFLLFPYTPSTGGVGDLHMVGRNMLLAAAKLAALVAGLGIASALGWLTWMVTGQEWIAFLLGSLGALLILSALLISLMVLVYDRLDVTKFQTP